VAYTYAVGIIRRWVGIHSILINSVAADIYFHLRRLRSCETKITEKESIAFEHTSKRRRGYPSETHVKRGLRIVHGDKELIEKLGRNDLCPCDSGRRFQELLPA